ncbi:MAG: phage baseplate assembly protein W [Crocinitomicaceae bacterium]|jgi:phage baseplate assembly protein W
MDKEEILGRGWGFPPSFDKSSNEAAMISGEDDVESSIYVIIHTKFGERVMRNEFGSNIYDLLFEPLNENMKTFMASTLKDSLVDNEPRINIEKITLTQNDPALGKVDIKVEFTMIETNVTKNLVVPFYVPDNI